MNQSLSALLCLSPSLTALDAAFFADQWVSIPIHFEMSSDDVGGRTLQFHEDFQHLRNYTYVSDPIFFPFPGENRLQKFFTDESHLILEVDDCSFVLALVPLTAYSTFTFNL